MANPENITPHQFQPGKSGNPAGRKSAGATIKEWVNALAEAGHTEDELRAIARDKKLPWTKRSAAERALRNLESGDLADFAGLLRGENSLEDLRGMGINTEVVKKFKQKTRKQMVGHGENAEVEEIIEREIELHDRAGADFDRVMDRTEGKPNQSLSIESNVILRTPDDRADSATEAAARLRSLLSPSGN